MFQSLCLSSWIVTQNKWNQGILKGKPWFRHFDIGYVLWKVNDLLFFHLWFRNTKIMDRDHLRVKFGHAQFQHQQASFSQRQDLYSHYQCLEAETWALFNVNPSLIKNWAEKVSTLLSLSVKKAALAFQDELLLVLGKRMRWCWLGSELMLIFINTGELFVVKFSLVANVKAAIFWKIQQWCWCKDKALRELQAASCEAVWASVRHCATHMQNDPWSHGGVKCFSEHDRKTVAQT